MKSMIRNQLQGKHGVQPGMGRYSSDRRTLRTNQDFERNCTVFLAVSLIFREEDAPPLLLVDLGMYTDNHLSALVVT